jgi:Domain of unknown function DUF29
MSDMSKPLYEEDFVRWTEQQARAIRDAASARINLPIDWENVAEEIDGLGRSQRTQVRNRILRIIEHLLKLQVSPAVEPRRGWEATVRNQRREIEGLLNDSPSLRQEVADLIEWALPKAREDVREDLARWGEQSLADPKSIRYTEVQVLGNWLPEHPHPVSRVKAPRRRVRNT